MSIVDTEGKPLIAQEQEPEGGWKPWQLNLYTKDWRPNPESTETLRDLEVVSLVNIYTSIYVNELKGAMDDMDLIDSTVEQALEAYGARMEQHQQYYFRMAMNQTIFQVCIQRLLMQGQKQSKLTEEVRAKMAKELVDQINRPDRKGRRRSGGNGN